MRIGKYKFVVMCNGKVNSNYSDLSDARYRLKDLKKTYPDNEYKIFNKITKDFEDI